MSLTLKQFTRNTGPYLFVIVILLAILSTMLLEEPILWLQSVLVVDRYWWSLGIYTALIAGATIFAPLSMAPTVPFMAKIFSPLAIFIVTWIGWMIGAIAVYFISRRWGQILVEKFFSIEKLNEFQTRMPNHMDFWLLLLLRTFIPVDILSYAVGLFTKISFGKYLWATAIGIVPFAFILSYGPDALVGGNPILLFVFFVLLFVMLTSLAIFYFSSIFKKKATIYTHSGKFHTDDVFATAAVTMILDQSKIRYEIIRTRDEIVLARAKQDARDGKPVYVLDVGGELDSEYNLFDHHQKGGAGIRDNTVEFASFGLVWRKFGERLCSSDQIAQRVDSGFVSGIDGPDNGQELFETTIEGVPPVTIWDIVERLYQQSANSDHKGQDRDFRRAVEWARSIIPLVIAKGRSQFEKEQLAERVYKESENKELIITDEYVGRGYFAKYDEPLLIVSPRTGDVNGQWGVVSVPRVFGGMHGKISFPRGWWGLNDKEFQEESGVVGALFCHRDGDFLLTAASRKSAIELAEIALKTWKSNQ